MVGAQWILENKWDLPASSWNKCARVGACCNRDRYGIKRMHKTKLIPVQRNEKLKSHGDKLKKKAINKNYTCEA